MWLKEPKIASHISASSKLTGKALIDSLQAPGQYGFELLATQPVEKSRDLKMELSTQVELEACRSQP